MSWLWAPVYVALLVIFDRASRKHGGEIVANILRHHGVERIFTLPGGHVSPIVVASDKLGIRVIDVRHEATAVFAADATARLSGIPGVAVVTAGPGLTNTVTAVKNAQMAESPVVIIAGAAATLLKNRGSLQDIDQLSLMKSVTKKCFTAECIRQIGPTLREAFRVAQVDTPGPVFVELPVDLLYPFNIIALQFANVANKARSIKGKIINAYTNYHLQYIFADAWKEQQYDPQPVSVKIASKRQVNKAANLLKNSQRPLIIMGSQAMLPPTKPEKLVQIIKKLRIPVYLNGAARGSLGTYDLNFRHGRKDAVKEADCVLLLGAICDFRLLYGRIFGKQSKVISVNRNIEQAKLNAGVFWSPTLAIESDVASFVTELETKVAGAGPQVDQSWLRQLQQRDAEAEVKLANMSRESANKFLNPLKVLGELQKVFENDRKFLIVDGGDFVASASYIMRSTEPLHWLDPGPFGTLGCGAGFALAAGLHEPGSHVVAIMGDGAFGYAIPELDTFVRHKIPVYFVIGNDACWTQIVREQVSMLGSPIGCELAHTDYHRVAEGFGALGFKLDNIQDLLVGRMLTTAKQQLISTKKPVVVNVMIGKTKFRDGSISV